jgi:lambda family phage tail tape measure protein
VAKQVQDILVTLGIKGYEELAKLKSAFKGLASTVDQSDAVLAEAREGILSYAKRAQSSEATLKGLEAALKGVREQATLHSPLYKQLTQDIGSVNSELAQLSVKYETVADRATKAATAQQNAANAAMRSRYLNKPTEAYVPAGATGVVAPTAYDEAIAAINEVNARSNTTISSLEEQRSAWQRLRSVVDPSSDAFRQATTNVKTLQERLDSLSITQKKVPEVQVDVSPYEKARAALGEVVKRSDNTIASLREQLNAWSMLREVVDPNSAAFDTASRRVAALQQRLNSLKITQEQVGKSSTKTVSTPYEEALKRLRDVKRTSDSTIQSLDEQRNAWVALRRAVDPSSAAFENATRNIKTLETRLDSLALKQDKVTKKRGLGAQGLTQIAGAAISGGIFGGPEGFLGGVAGGALGGVGGAFAGAAIGAQVAGLRQAAGAAAEYAAAINQQRRALSGVVEDSAAYQQSLAFIDQTSRALAIPQEQVTRNFTRLAASVIGAGGNVNAAQEAFMGISSAILGTGGTLADLDGALLATAQIFSKGKVSAEELRGQIGERLPGAFTLFAESIGKTPAELDKMLEKGQVSLNDFMKFVRLASSDYGKNVVLMSQSSEAAGRRLATTWARMQEEIGKALQPIGAEFQDTLSRFLSDNETQLVELAKGLAGAAKAFLDLAISVGPALVGLGKLALAFGASVLATKAYIALRGPFVTALLAMRGAMGTMTAQAAAAQTRLLALGASVKALAASLAVPIVLTIAIQGIAQVISNLERIKRLKQEVTDLPSVEDFISSRYKGSAVGPQDRQQLIRDLEETNEAVAKQQIVAGKAQTKLQELSAEAKKLFSTKKPKADELLVARAEADKELAALNNLIERRKELGRLMGTVGTGSPAKPFEFPTDPTKDKDEASRKARDEAARLAAEQQRLDEALMRQGIELDDLRFRNKMDLVRREYELRRELEERERNLWASTFRGRGAESARALTDLLQQVEAGKARSNELEAELRLRRQALISAQRMERVTSQGISGAPAGTSGLAGGRGAAPAGGGSQTRALVAAAQKLGINPLDLATIIGFETGGTYNPSQWGGAGGRHMGLIQFGPSERKAYGAYQGQSFEEQITGPVVRYFQERFRGVGMSTQGADLLTLYRTVLGGNPKASLGGRDAFGTSPQSGVAAMGPHRTTALNRFFGGDVANVPAATGAPGGATQIRRDVAAEGSVAQAKENVAQQEKLIAIERKNAEDATKLSVAEFIQKTTKSLDDQTYALEQNYDAYQARLQVEETGMRSEFVEAEMEKLRLYQEQGDALAPLLEAQKIINDPEVLETINTAIQKINDSYSRQTEIVNNLAKAQTERGVALRTYLGQQRRELAKMVDIEQIVIQGAQAIEQAMSTAMSAAVTSVITGVGSIRQALSDAFEAIGQAFIQMAMQIIAKQLVMITLQTILKALGGATGGGANMADVGKYADTATNVTLPSIPAPSAKGNAFTPQGPVERYAKGGIVNAPTLFRYAKGGTFAPGLMGEAGPEAILPLRRTPDGRLGVTQVRSPQDADRMREMMGRSPAQQQAPMLNLKFETTTINGVEYVSREQLEVAMAETRKRASKEGAERGMSMTLDKMRNSPRTRAQVGMR